jgi:hypothetical protein
VAPKDKACAVRKAALPAAVRADSAARQVKKENHGLKATAHAVLKAQVVPKATAHAVLKAQVVPKVTAHAALKAQVVQKATAHAAALKVDLPRAACLVIPRRPSSAWTPTAMAASQKTSTSQPLRKCAK